MRRSGWMKLMAAVFSVGILGGCVSLDEHNRLKQANRLLTADRDQTAQELADERKNSDLLRNRLQSYEREGMTKDELLANLRGENDLLDKMRKMTQSELEEALGRIGNITIEGSKLPAPLDSALKRFAEEHPSEVEYDAQRGFVKWKADLVFPLGSDVVKDSSLSGLRGFTDVLKSVAAADFEVLVVGHTDTVPIQRSDTKAKHPTNWHLSAHRSIAVSNVLQQYGYPAQKISVMGCGEYRPIADNSNESGKSRNRRVEIYLIPRGSIVQGSMSAPVASRGSSRPTASNQTQTMPVQATQAEPMPTITEP